MIVELILLLVAIWGFFYWSFKAKSNHWTKLGIRQPESNSFPLGNNVITMAETRFGRKHMIDVMDEYYTVFKDVPYFGTYGMGGRPILVVRDLDQLRNIQGKDIK
jgi:hypothetical protein